MQMTSPNPTTSKKHKVEQKPKPSGSKGACAALELALINHLISNFEAVARIDGLGPAPVRVRAGVVASISLARSTIATKLIDAMLEKSTHAYSALQICGKKSAGTSRPAASRSWIGYRGCRDRDVDADVGLRDVDLILAECQQVASRGRRA